MHQVLWKLITEADSPCSNLNPESSAVLPHTLWLTRHQQGEIWYCHAVHEKQCWKAWPACHTLIPHLGGSRGWQGWVRCWAGMCWGFGKNKKHKPGASHGMAGVRTWSQRCIVHGYGRQGLNTHLLSQPPACTTPAASSSLFFGNMELGGTPV